MNRSDWETELVHWQLKEGRTEKQLRYIRTRIAECFTNIELKRRQEVISNRQMGSRRRKALADVTYPGKEIDGTKI